MKKLIFVFFIFSVLPLFCLEGFSQTGKELEGQALDVFDSAPLQEKPKRAKAYEEAAGFASRAALAYAKEGNIEKSRLMQALAREAGHLAEDSRMLAAQEIFSLYSIESIGYKYKVLTHDAETPARPQRHWVTPVVPRASTSLVTFEVGVSVATSPFDIFVPSILVNHTFDEYVYTDPEVFMLVLEHYGGEFWVGEIAGELHHEVTMAGTTSVMPGLGIAFSPFRNLEVRFFGQLFQAQWSGSYTVSVFDFEPTEPRLELEPITASAKGFLVDAGIKYIFPGNFFRPYLEGGTTRQIISSSQIEMQVANFFFPLDIIVANSQFSGYGGAGARFYLADKVFLQVGAKYSRFPATGYGFGGGASVGVSF